MDQKELLKRAQEDIPFQVLLALLFGEPGYAVIHGERRRAVKWREKIFLIPEPPDFSENF